MRISFIRQIKDSHFLSLGIEGEGESFRFTVSASAYASLGRPAVGEELSEHVLAELSFADELYRAEKKALSLLSYADNNEKNLCMKLQRAGFSREVARTVCERMVSLGYVDERRQLERLVLRAANEALLSPRRITEKLCVKGYSRSLVTEVIRELEAAGDVDFDDSRRRLIMKLPEDASEDDVKKLLFKYGYKQ